MVRQHDLDVPEGWNVDEYRMTGRLKLVAKFTHSSTEAVLNVVPYKTYGQSSFNSAHRVTLTRDSKVAVVADGLEVEDPEEAEGVAIQTMKELNEKD